MKKVPRIHVEMTTYTPDEIRRVLRAADKDRNGHLWYLALSGLRRGEIANRVQAGAGNVVEGDPKTLSSRRTLPLDDGLVNVLRRSSARYAEERLALGAAHADSGYVAVNVAGEPYTPDTLTRMWHKLGNAAPGRDSNLWPSAPETQSRPFAQVNGFHLIQATCGYVQIGRCLVG
jgi:integrase